jgi:hypothetical protein
MTNNDQTLTSREQQELSAARAQQGQRIEETEFEGRGSAQASYNNLLLL